MNFDSIIFKGVFTWFLLTFLSFNLFSQSKKEQIELLEMQKDGIMVAEYWTVMPPKEELEAKLHQLLIETKERIARNKSIEK